MQKSQKYAEAAGVASKSSSNIATMKNILILCTGNSCRSQIAEGYLNHFAGGKALVYSAGIEKHGVNPLAVETMQEDGIDISNQTSNHVDEYAAIDFDWVITVCDNAKEHCPYFSSAAKRVHQNFTDPARINGTDDERRQAFRLVRQQIKAFCKEFAETVSE